MADQPVRRRESLPAVSNAKSGVRRLSESDGARFKRIGPAKAFDRIGIARVDPLRLVARKQDELWFQAQFANSIEKCFGILSVSKESLQRFGRNDDGLRRRLSNCRDGPGHERLTMLSYVEPGHSLSQRVVSAAFCLALGHEITMLQQLRSVLLQKPLDRSRTRLMWSHVDVADALSHAGSSRVFPRKGETEHIC